MRLSRAKRVFLLVNVFLATACANKRTPEIQAPPQASSKPQLDSQDSDPAAGELLAEVSSAERINAKALKGTLKFDLVRVGTTPAAFISSELGSTADYVSYEACLVKQPQRCSSGKTAAPSAIVFDLPAGDLKITTQACVMPEKAAGTPCAPPSISYFKMEEVPKGEEQQLLFELSDLSQQTTALALETREALKKYQATKGNSTMNKDLDTLVTNQLAMSPYRIGALYDSEYYDAVKKQAAETATTNPKLALSNTGATVGGSTLISFGSVALASGVWGVYSHASYSNPAYLEFKNFKNKGKAYSELFVADLWGNRSRVEKAERQLISTSVLGDVKQELNEFMGVTKKAATKSSYQAIALAGAVSVVTGILVSAILSTQLTDAAGPASQLLQESAAIEAKIASLKEKKAAVLGKLLHST